MLKSIVAYYETSGFSRENSMQVICWFMDGEWLRH